MPTEPSEFFEKVNAVFSEALAHAEADRPALVRARCAGDEAMIAEVMQMLTHYANLGEFLAEPVVRAFPSTLPEIRSGELLSDRFHIIDLLGRGGMGEVYRARDSVSQEIVAVKTLRSDFLGDPSAEERFRQELILARRIAHPNVCRIHELFGGTRDGRPFLCFAMEYLEGETLADKIRERPLPSAQALAIARQIAAGLDAAHSLGILHRDMKPANIFLSGDRAVITDFGLAKVFTAARAGGPTLTGQTPGTRAYMSPEQFLGETLTPQSDIFAFGLVIFEMLTGRHPFPREDVKSALRRASPALEAGWARALDRALNPIPAARYASAGALVEDIERRRIFAPLLTRRSLILAASAAGLSSATLFLRSREGVGMLPASPLLMLTPLTQSAEALTAQSLDVLLSSQLTQSARVRLISKDQIAAQWRLITGTNNAPPLPLKPSAARDIALRQGVDFVVFGNLGRTGDDYVLNLRLELMGSDPSHARKTWIHAFTVAGRSDLPSAAFDAASWIRSTLGESVPDLQARSRRPEEMTTSSWQALEEYTQAEQSWNARNTQAALIHLHTALDLDPSFALAAFRVADILASLAQEDQAFVFYRKASDLIRQKNLTDRESLRIRGLFLQDAREDEEAERVFARWSIEYPRDPLPLFYRATSLDRLGRFDESLRLGRRAIELEPSRASFIYANAERLLNSGHVRECEAEAKRLPADSTDWTDILFSSLALSKSDLNETWRRLERLRNLGSPRYRSLAYTWQACYRAEQGRWSDAEALCLEGLEYDAANALSNERYVKRRQLAQISLRQGKKSEAGNRCHEILAGKPSYRQTMETGCLLARTGDYKAARACAIPDLPDLPVYRRWSLRLEGEIALGQGDPKRALTLIAQAPLITVGFWREDILDAALAAGDESAARSQLLDLFSNPGRAWRTASYGSPGFITRAAALSTKFDLPEPVRAIANRLGTSFASPIDR